MSPGLEGIILDKRCLQLVIWLCRASYLGLGHTRRPHSTSFLGNAMLVTVAQTMLPGVLPTPRLPPQ
jgi:hypothetical protein